MRIRNLFVAAAIVCAAITANAEERFERTFSRTLTYHGGRIEVDHSFGSIKLRGAAGSQVSVRAEIRASDSDFGREIKVTVSEVGNGIVIRTEYPDRHFTIRNGNFSYS